MLASGMSDDALYNVSDNRIFSVLGKRKAGAVATIVKSVYSYLMGALRNNFDGLKERIVKYCGTISVLEQPYELVELLLEELFRYLYLLARNSPSDAARFPPPNMIKESLQCLMLDPVLYLQICDELLTMNGNTEDKVRVLPYDALTEDCSDDAGLREWQQLTAVRYERIFGNHPPDVFWLYSNNMIRVEESPSQIQPALNRPPDSEQPAVQVQPLPIPLPLSLSLPLSLPIPLPIPLPISPALSTVTLPLSALTTLPEVADASRTQEKEKSIRIRVQDASGRFEDFTVSTEGSLKPMMLEFAERQHRRRVKMYFNGMNLLPTMTARGLRLQDGDVFSCTKIRSLKEIRRAAQKMKLRTRVPAPLSTPLLECADVASEPIVPPITLSAEQLNSAGWDALSALSDVPFVTLPVAESADDSTSGLASTDQDLTILEPEPKPEHVHVQKPLPLPTPCAEQTPPVLAGSRQISSRSSECIDIASLRGVKRAVPDPLCVVTPAVPVQVLASASIEDRPSAAGADENTSSSHMTASNTASNTVTNTDTNTAIGTDRIDTKTIAPPVPACVTIKVQHMTTCDVYYFKVKRLARLRKLMTAYADRSNNLLAGLRFRYCGREMGAEDTADSLKMAEDATVVVFDVPVLM